MKYLLLPINLIEFWYPEGAAFFIRTWKNFILFLEEDLAVILMWKLLLIPLFHDSSYVGRVLSFLFRLSRIFMGIFAFASITIFIFIAGVYWMILPVLAILNIPNLFSPILFLIGLGLFVINIITYPQKKVWQISSKDLYKASFLKEKDLNLAILLKNQGVLSLLENLEIKPESLPVLSLEKLDEIGVKALELAKKTNSKYITGAHFFVAILENNPNIDNFLVERNLKILDFENALNHIELRKNKWRKVYVWDEDFAVHHLKGVNRGWLGAPTPNLSLVGEDLTMEASKVGFDDFERSNGVPEEIINILSQETGRNVIIVGAPGVGKSSLIRHLADLIIAGDAPPALAIKRLVLLDLSKLVSGMQNQGDLAGRIKAIFDEVSFSQNVIIAVEEIHELLELYPLMQPYLESDKFQFIGTTELENYSNILEKNGAFARIFRKVELPPATVVETMKIMEDMAIKIESKGKIRITYLSVKEIVDLSSKLLHQKVLPDSAISVFKEAITKAENGWVTSSLIKHLISQTSKVPILDLGNVDKNKLLNLESEIHASMIDQVQAVEVVSNTLRRSSTGMREENRPIGSFLFVGPTGVGKTELAKTLAEVFFKTSGAFVRFDMSEYQNPESVGRFMGSNGNGGLLTEAIREKPYCLLLLDEFEKADPKILTLFLQVLDDGRLTDGTGRLIDFTNTIIIATSNAASLTIAQGLANGKDMYEIDKLVNQEILQVFKPELINRFDDIVIFKPLSELELEEIVKLKLTSLQSQMRAKGYILEFDEALVSELGKRGFDPVLGARPLRRLIQDTLESNLSKLILEEKLVKGKSFKAGIELL